MLLRRAVHFCVLFYARNKIKICTRSNGAHENAEQMIGNPLEKRIENRKIRERKLLHGRHKKKRPSVGVLLFSLRLHITNLVCARLFCVSHDPWSRTPSTSQHLSGTMSELFHYTHRIKRERILSAFFSFIRTTKNLFRFFSFFYFSSSDLCSRFWVLFRWSISSIVITSHSKSILCLQRKRTGKWGSE